MGRYRTSSRTEPAEDRQPRPIWRGIGCLLIIIIPVISFAAAELTMPLLLKRGLVPVQLLFTPDTPKWLWNVPFLLVAYQFLFARYAIFATLLLTFIYILVIGGFFSVIYAFMYQITGPSRYGPMDAPPPRTKIKKYKR